MSCRSLRSRLPQLPRPLKNWGAQWLVREILDARDRRLRQYPNRTEKQRAYRARRKQREKSRAASPQRDEIRDKTPRFVIEARQRLLLDAAQGHVAPAADFAPILAHPRQGLSGAVFH